MESTVVQFPQGDVRGIGRVVRCDQTDHGWAVVTDRTVFHPLDHTWPDQPADRGRLGGVAISDCRTGAIGPDGVLMIDSDIPVRRGEEGWTWVVVHLMDGTQPPPEVGQEVALEVDPEYRTALSRAHTACHLAALALNEVTAEMWRKDPPRRDSLGNPDFDGLAVTRSRIGPGRSVDDYRIGKSLRKKGLNEEAVLADLSGLAQKVTERVRGWLETAAPVRIETGSDPTVTARRTWTVELPEGIATYPCGGTHVQSLADLPPVEVRYEPGGEGFTATTVVG